MIKNAVKRSKHLFFFVLTTLFFIRFFTIQLSANESNQSRTDYGDQGIDTYAKTKHGPDGALFLDPFFIPHLLNLQGQVILDAGCGAGPWSIFAAKNGAFVHGIDVQDSLSKQAPSSVPICLALSGPKRFKKSVSVVTS